MGNRLGCTQARDASWRREVHVCMRHPCSQQCLGAAAWNRSWTRNFKAECCTHLLDGEAMRTEAPQLRCDVAEGHSDPDVAAARNGPLDGRLQAQTPRALLSARFGCAQTYVAAAQIVSPAASSAASVARVRPQPLTMGKARMIDSREVKHKSAKLWLWIVWLVIMVRARPPSHDAPARRAASLRARSALVVNARTVSAVRDTSCFA